MDWLVLKEPLQDVAQIVEWFDQFVVVLPVQHTISDNAIRND